jgi:hypothetical protein
MLLTTASIAMADSDVRIQPTLVAGVSSSDLRFDDRDSVAYGSLRLKAEATGDYLGAEGDFRVYRESGYGTSPLIDVHEALLRLQYRDWRVNVGRQIVTWGRADKVNPTDKFFRADYTLLSSDDEDQRRGIDGLMIGTSTRYGDFKLYGELSPRVSNFYYPFSIPVVNVLPSDKSVSLRFDHFGGALDWGAYSYRGNDHLPFFMLDTATPAIVQRYDRVSMLGLDAAYATADVTWRGEMAYAKTDDSGGADPYKRNSTIAATIGFDSKPIADVSLLLQYFGIYVLDYRLIQSADRLSLLSAAVGFQTRQYQHGLTLRVQRSWRDEKLNAELNVLTFLGQRQYIFNPKIIGAITGSFRIIVGGKFYQGDDDGLLGLLHQNSTVYVEFRLEK